MPELPEVETIARSLRGGLAGQPQPPERSGPALPGRRFLEARIFWERTLASPSIEALQARLPGQKVLEIGRRGKFLVLQLDQDALVFHLRMSGDLRLSPAAGPDGKPLEPDPHDRAIFELDGGLRLSFNDPRKFGRIWLAPDAQEVTGCLGPEPFDPALTAQAFHQMLASRRRQLKPLLLDQSFLAGLGNIYTDEALHLAGLHPLEPSDQLSPAQAARLLDAIRAVLAEGIRRNGASIDWVYRGGSFQNHFRAYGRTGQPCPVCGQPIERIQVGQRGTHFCPACQPS